jgi:hypothetical protein
VNLSPSSKRVKRYVPGRVHPSTIANTQVTVLPAFFMKNSPHLGGYFLTETDPRRERNEPPTSQTTRNEKAGLRPRSRKPALTLFESHPRQSRIREATCFLRLRMPGIQTLSFVVSMPNDLST